MFLYVVNLMLAIAWATVSGSFSLANLVFGFLLGSAIFYLLRESIGSLTYFTRSFRFFSLLALFFYELGKSALIVAMVVIRPRLDVKPGILRYPLKVKSDAGITLLANLITLTPGTLSVDVSPDKRFLFVHALDCSDPDALRDDIASGFERKILESFK